MSVTLRCSRGIEQGVSWLQKAPRSGVAALEGVGYLPAMKTLLPLLCLLSALLSSCSPGPPAPPGPPAFVDESSADKRVKALIVEAESGKTRAKKIEAMTTLGLSYSTGTDVLKDKKKAVEWYRKAAELGGAKAMGRLADHYGFGWGVPRDPVEQHAWVKLSAHYSKTYRAQLSQTAVLIRLNRKMSRQQEAQSKQRYEELLKEIQKKAK